MKKSMRFFCYFNGLLFIFFIIFLNACNESETSLIGNWVRKSDFDGFPRNNAISFVIGNKVYVGLGYDGEDYLGDLWEYDPSLDFWVRKANFPGLPRTSAVAFTINGKGYVGTGFDGDKRLNDFWEYDPNTNSWTRKADFAGAARRNAVGFCVLDKGYIGAGNDGNDVKDFWSYNPTTDTWEQIVSIGGSKRINPFVMVINEKAYVGGGKNNGLFLEDFWEFNPQTQQWTRKEDLDEFDDNLPRESAVTFTLNGKGYLITGSRGSALGDCWEYNPDLDEWEQKTSFEGRLRMEAVGFSVQGRGFVALGRNSLERYDDIWEFKPEEEQD